jgi:hypothetical protein
MPLDSGMVGNPECYRQTRQYNPIKHEEKRSEESVVGNYRR